MKIKIQTETKVLFERELTNGFYFDEDAKIIQAFNKREITSYLIEFKEGETVEQTNNLNKISPFQINAVTLTIK